MLPRENKNVHLAYVNVILNQYTKRGSHLNSNLQPSSATMYYNSTIKTMQQQLPLARPSQCHFGFTF